MHIFTNWAEILHIFQYVLFIFSDFRLTSTIELIRMYAIAKDDSNKCSNLFLRKKMNLAAKKRENLYIWALNHENLYKRSLMWREKELTVLNTFIFWKWKMTWTDHSLTQAGGSKTGPWGKRRVFSDNDVVSLLSHISLLRCSSALMCYFVLFLILWNNVMLEVGAVPLRSHQNASWTAVRLQMANAKSAFLLQITKSESRENSLSCLSFHSSPLDLSQLNSHFLNKTYQAPASFHQ